MKKKEKVSLILYSDILITYYMKSRYELRFAIST